MADHDAIRAIYYKPLSKVQFEDMLQQVFGSWLVGTQSTSGLQAVVGAFASKWGDNAQTRAITAAINEWNRPPSETGMGSRPSVR